ncbi:efflux transporter, RND family, MFP subunit [Lacticaseibacillus paracasei]|uniref:efflux RND transporter periplasmic adaptor subunit n=1 Tax=Lacticaseibacillus paracasei TaxID=1597 RepID=UPI000F0B87AC|nr:efflux RND transporter periplasmic adaptor subunit [Lacticaseibacillus paracasei]RND87178.1 efflux transporter, RND family, MFP subunit [Lacticaseibacillus paracasei]
MNKGRSKGKRISQRMVIIGIGALAMIGVTVFFLVTSKKPTSSPAPTTIATFQVKKHELRVPGQVQAVCTQKIDIPEGTVQNMTVKNGDSVTLDQQLLTVYKPDVQAKIDEASRALEKQQRSQATLDQQISQIKATLSKTAADDPQKSALQTQLDEAQNNRQDSADAITQSNQDIAKLKQSLNTVVKAPFAGRLYIDYQANGSQTITETSAEVEAVGEVSEFDYSSVKIGQSATVQALASKTKQATDINFISSDPAKSSKPNLAKYELTTKLRDGFLNGQSITITIPLSGLLIPKEAVKDGAVFKIVNKRAIRTKVTYVAKDDMYEVSDGLSSGDRILQKPDKTIKDGAKVNVDD